MKAAFRDYIEVAAVMIEDAARELGYRTSRSLCRTETVYLACWQDELRLCIRIGEHHGPRKKINRYVQPRDGRSVESAIAYLARRSKSHNKTSGVAP